MVLTSDMADARAPPTAERLQHVDVNIKDVYVSSPTWTRSTYKECKDILIYIRDNRQFAYKAIVR